MELRLDDQLGYGEHIAQGWDEEQTCYFKGSNILQKMMWCCRESDSHFIALVIYKMVSKKSLHKMHS